MKEKKTCCRCKIEKAISEFYLNRNRPDGLQGYCISCDKLRKALWYTKNKRSCIERSKRNRNRKMDGNSEKIFLFLLGNPCLDCGETDPIVLDFDHVRGKKVSSVSQMLAQCAPWAVIENEIKKCEIRCANCHRKKTSRQFNWRMLKIQAKHTKTLDPAG